MENDKVKQLVSVYVMVNDELHAGKFLQKQFYDIAHIVGRRERGPMGVLCGTPLDIAAQLMENDRFFSEYTPDIGSFRCNGRMGLIASIKPVSDGLVATCIGNIVATPNGFEFKPSEISPKEYLADLRSEQGFVDYAAALKLEADGIAVENGFLRVYGEHQKLEGTNLLRSYRIEDIAKKVFRGEQK